jgi:hypothetical protein
MHGTGWGNETSVARRVAAVEKDGGGCNRRRLEKNAAVIDGRYRIGSAVVAPFIGF